MITYTFPQSPNLEGVNTLISIDMGPKNVGAAIFQREGEPTKWNLSDFFTTSGNILEARHRKLIKEVSKLVQKPSAALLIEAPLSYGFCDDESAQRFFCGNSEGSRAWYSNAGAVTALAALQFLRHLGDLFTSRISISVFESFLASKKPALKIWEKLLSREDENEAIWNWVRLDGNPQNLLTDVDEHVRDAILSGLALIDASQYTQGTSWDKPEVVGNGEHRLQSFLDLLGLETVNNYNNNRVPLVVHVPKWAEERLAAVQAMPNPLPPLTAR
jgi:hypothetical protein